MYWVSGYYLHVYFFIVIYMATLMNPYCHTDWNMGRAVRVARGYNVFLMLLLVVQLAILLGIIIAMAYLGVGSVISIITIVSPASLIVLSLPISILQYLSSKDKTLKRIFTRWHASSYYRFLPY